MDSAYMTYHTTTSAQTVQLTTIFGFVETGLKNQVMLSFYLRLHASFPNGLYTCYMAT